jgi:hypothetical protein
MPMQEILLHTACELQAALRGIDGRTDPNQFDARGWDIKVTLNPKIETEAILGAGLTRIVPSTSDVLKYSTWVLGNGNGVNFDLKGNKTGSVDFKFDSEALIKNTKLPCHQESLSYHSLTKTLGIREWLFRSARAMELTDSAIDAPTFTADVIITFGGNGSYTYTFPPGTNLATLGGSFQLQETLGVVFSAKPKVAVVVTLPKGGEGFYDNRARQVHSTTTLLERQETSLQQIRQQLQNLRQANR